MGSIKGGESVWIKVSRGEGKEEKKLHGSKAVKVIEVNWEIRNRNTVLSK